MCKVTEGDWIRFGQWLDELRRCVGQEPEPRLLFRGQGDGGWKLETTLERNGYRTMPLNEYYRLITRIGTCRWSVHLIKTPIYDPEVMTGFSDREALFAPNRFPSGIHYEYMAYLRHHGFPSPLLDWSRSPYIAAFFAFRHARPGDGKRSSIYGYCDSMTGVRGGAVGERAIRTLGPYVRTHPRHFLQQSVYTVCESFNAQSGWQYDSHQAVFEGPRPGQDFLWRFDLPVYRKNQNPAPIKRIQSERLFTV